MPMFLSSPNMLIIYDYADTAGEFHVEIELVGDNKVYPHGWEGIPAEVYFYFDPDEARDSDDPTAVLAAAMEAEGYEVDESCSTGEIGAVLHVINNIDEEDWDSYTVYTKSGDRFCIYDDQLFSIDEGLNGYESMPVAWQHGGWYISEVY